MSADLMHAVATLLAAAAAAGVAWYFAAGVKIKAGWQNGTSPLARWLDARRRAAFNAQLPEALATMSNALRAGFSISQAFDSVVEQGEAPIDAAKRELLEETGYGGGYWQETITIGQNPSICDNITHCFLAEGVERVSDQHLDAGEDIAVLLLSRDEVEAMLRENRQLQALMAAPMWRYFAEHK